MSKTVEDIYPRRTSEAENFFCDQCDRAFSEGVLFQNMFKLCSSCMMLGFAQVVPEAIPQKSLLIALIEANCNVLGHLLTQGEPNLASSHCLLLMNLLRDCLRGLSQ